MLKNSSQLKTVVIVRGSGECRVLTICRHYARPSVEAIRKLQRAGETRGPSGDPRTTKTTTIKQETPLAAYFPHLSNKRHHWLHTIHIQQTRDLIGCVLSAFNKQETSLAAYYPHSSNKCIPAYPYVKQNNCSFLKFMFLFFHYIEPLSNVITRVA